MERKTYKKIFIMLILVALLSTIVFANYKTKYNPWTNRLQYVNDGNSTEAKSLLNEVDISDNLTVHGYTAMVSALSSVKVANQSITNVSSSTLYNLTNRDINESSFKAYAVNGSNIVLIDSTNYTLYAALGKWQLDVTTWDRIFNATLDYERMYLPQNLSVGDLYVEGNVIANINWTMLQNYPSSCPTGSYLTQLDDSVTCTSATRISGENVTGNYDFINGSITFSGVNPTIQSQGICLANGTNAYTFNASYLEKNATTNLNMSGLNITNVADLYVDTIHGGSPVTFADGINMSFNGTASNITNLNYLFADFLEGDGSGLTDLTAYNDSYNALLVQNQSLWNEAWNKYNGSYLERNATSDLNMTNHTFWDIDKLYFHLGEYIDNLVDGWIKLTGSLFVTGELNVTGPTTFNDNLNVTEKNITNINFLNEDVNVTGLISEPPYISDHTNAVMAILADSQWLNVSFNESATEIISKITHTYNDDTNDSFTTQESGIYSYGFSVNFQDSTSSPESNVATRLWADGVGEVEGSLFEKDTTKQNAVGTMHHSGLTWFAANTVVKLQFVANTTAVILTNKAVHGIHRDTATLKLVRID